METTVNEYNQFAILFGCLCFTVLVVGPFAWLFYMVTVQRAKRYVMDLTEFAARNGLDIDPELHNTSSPVSGLYRERPLQLGYVHEPGRKTFRVVLQTNAPEGHYLHIFSGSFRRGIGGIGVEKESRVQSGNAKFDAQFASYGRPPETVRQLIEDKPFQQALQRLSWRARGKSVLLSLENKTLTYEEIDPMFNMIEMSQIQRSVNWLSEVADTLEKIKRS